MTAARDAANELESCAICGQAKWVHILPRRVRLERNVLDDGHAFDAVGGQLSLSFGRRTIDRTQKKPPQKVMAKDPQKKPLQRQPRKATKPGKRRVA